MARELGKAIQEDDRYLALRLATQSNDEDQALQDMIGEFNLKRVFSESGSTKSKTKIKKN